MKKIILITIIFIFSQFSIAQPKGKNLLLEYYKNKRNTGNNSNLNKNNGASKNSSKLNIKAPQKGLKPSQNAYTDTMNTVSTNFFESLKEGKAGIEKAVDQMYGKGTKRFHNPAYGEEFQDINKSLGDFLVSDDKVVEYKLVGEETFTKGYKIIRTYYAQTKKGRQANFKMLFLDAGLGKILLLRVEMDNYQKGPNE
jgi:hypothetical protein